MKQATIKGDKISLKFYSKNSGDFYNTLDQVKQIEGRTFDSKAKVWSIPLSIPSIEKIRAIGFDIDSDILEWRKEHDSRLQEIQEEIESIDFSDSTLYDYQVPHAKQIIQSILKNNSALDASDTGTGKTYVALAVAKYMGLFPIVVTPKSVIPSWEKAAKVFGIDISVLNYEQYRNGNSDWLEKGKTESGKDIFKWNTDKSHLVIFDEVHRCKNQKTKNSQMLRAVRKSESKCIGLSATIGDNPLHLYSVGFVLGLFSSVNEFWSWAYSRGVYKAYFGVEFNPSEENLRKIHADLFPERGSRISIKDLGDKFPENLVISDCYDMNSSGKKIQAVYDEMRDELHRLSISIEKDKGTSMLTEILRARQQIELLKVPTIVEMAEDLVAEGNSVAVFVNFKETIQSLSDKLQTNCIIDGSVTGDDRQNNIDSFQDDRERIILCNIQAGGVGISLHDLNGTYSRVSLICPTFSGQDLVQALGRIHRAGAQSPAIQKILFCAGTIEEEIAEAVSLKVDRISMINDGDLSAGLTIYNKGE